MGVIITKQGRNMLAKEKHEAACWECKTEFTFEPGDAKLILDLRDGDYYLIDCPNPGCPKTLAVQTRRSQYER